MVASLDMNAEALAQALRVWRDKQMPRAEVLALLRDFDLDDEEAEAVIARGVARGLLSDGTFVRAT